MDNKLDFYQKTAILIAIISIIIIFAGFLISPSGAEDHGGERSASIVPDTVQTIDAQTKKYTFELEDTEEFRCLYFVSDLERVYVYQDKRLIYRTDEGTTPIGKTPGKIFHFVEIPSQKCSITILSRSNYTDHGALTFLIGNGQLMMREKLMQSLPYFIVYFITFLGGILLLLYWIAVRKELINRKIGLYFSLLLIVSGLWLIRGSDFVNILLQDHIAIYFMGYILFLQLPFLFFAFIVHYWGIQCRPWLKNTYFIGSCLNMMSCVLLHVLGVKEFRETALVTHILLLAAFIYAFYGMYIYWRKHKFDYKIILTGLPLLVAFTSVSIDYFGFYSSHTGSYKRGGIVILFFLICISAIVFYELSLQLQEGRKNAIYKKLAITDLVTGLNNRNAYEAWEKEHSQNFDGIAIILCDLNNLKYYNDHYGHEVGDRYIIAAAEILQSVIGDKGICYRIGGDEFIVVLKNTAFEEVRELFDKIESMQLEFNKGSAPLHMSMAYGYAAAEENDQFVTDVVRRADAAMYIHKKQIKASGKAGEKNPPHGI